MQAIEQYTRRFALDTIDRRLQILFPLKEIQGIEHISNLRKEYLQHQMPIIFAFNHLGLEVVRVYETALQIVGDDSKLIVPVSEHYLHYKNFPIYALAVSLAQRILTSQFPPVIQSYRIRDDTLSDEHLNELSKRSQELGISTIRSIVKGFQNGACVIIAPEGHRSHDYTLLPAEVGSGLLIRTLNKLKKQNKIPDARIVPIAFEPFDRSGLFNRQHYKMTIGEPVDPQNILDLATELAQDYGINNGKPNPALASHALMLKIAELMSPERRGVYDVEDQRFEQVLLGELKLGINNAGEVDVFNYQASRMGE